MFNPFNPIKMLYSELKTVKYDAAVYRLFDADVFESGQPAKIFFIPQKYMNGTLAIEVMYVDSDIFDHSQDAAMSSDCWSVATKNFNHFLQDDESHAFADTNNNGWLLDFIRKTGIAKTSGVTLESGFCSYPLLEWDTKKFYATED